MPILMQRPIRTALFGLALGATGLEAQQTYDACYVPSVGAIYLINLPGLHTECLAPSHVAISWTEGGALEDGSVTAVKLADGSVITIKLADGAVTTAKLAFDPATQAELDALAAAGTINEATNPVDWTRLKNVPSDFADGVDHSGGTPSDLVCTGCVGTTDIADAAVTTLQLADGAITDAKLAFDNATEADLVAHAGSADHDGRYYTEAELNDAGTINTVTNPVDWTQLKSVPAGFADGTDDVGGVSDHGALTGLGDDDHTQYLPTNGVRDATDGFAVTGTYGVGTMPVSGGGVRLMWHPGRGVFRAGAAFGTAWDDANAGDYSVAIGASPIASGDYAMAIGPAAVASGPGSTALGFATTASGDTATALGSGTTASGRASTAMGTGTTAEGWYSTAMGQGTTASGGASLSVGFNTEASGEGAIATGSGSTASGQLSTAMGGGTTASAQSTTALGSGSQATVFYATAMGLNTTASAYASTAMGSSTIASGDFSTAAGVGTTAQPYNSVVIGRFNVVGGTSTFWVPTDPLFIAGNGDGLSRTNALTLFKDGNLTIAGTLTESSDIRLKEEIEPLEGTLDGVLRLTPIRYRFRDGTGHPTERQIGLSAQEVERLFPELVKRDSQGYLSVAYTDLAAVLVRAVQEQHAETERLHEAIAKLNSDNAELRAAVRALRRQLEANGTSGQRH